MDSLLSFFTGPLNTAAWSYVFLPCVLVGGLFLTIRNRGVQLCRFGYALRRTVGKLLRKDRAGEGAVTPLQAVSTALASTVGTGNIVGIAQAIAMGGCSAVFWLWLAALLGMVIKYCEVALSIRFRERDARGDWVGGPMYYIKNGLGKRWRWLGTAFCVLAALAGFGIGNMSQANAIAGAVNNAVAVFFPDAVPYSASIALGVGVLTAFFAALILLGGIKRIGAVTEKLIPLMSLLYIALTLSVIFGNLRGVGRAFERIFREAFTPGALGGAAGGIALRETIVWGLRRSAFSNEAGLGTAAIAHAAAETPSPVDQGLYGIFEVLVDTIVICTLTALTILVSGVEIPFGAKPGPELVTAAFATVFGGKLAALLVAVTLLLFAFSTIVGWALYGSRCVAFLFGIRAAGVYQVLFIAAVVVGAASSVDVVWDIADTLNGLMAIPNFIALFALSGTVAKLTRAYFFSDRGKRRQRNDPPADKLHCNGTKN